MTEEQKNELRQIERNLSQILVSGDAAVLMGDAIIRLRRMTEDFKENPNEVPDSE